MGMEAVRPKAKQKNLLTPLLRVLKLQSWQVFLRGNIQSVPIAVAVSCAKQAPVLPVWIVGGALVAVEKIVFRLQL